MARKLETPKYLNLYTWAHYAIYRNLIAKPIPAPNVWDNALFFERWKKGNYKKDKFFDSFLFKPPKEINSHTQSKFDGGLQLYNPDNTLPNAFEEKALLDYNYDLILNLDIEIFEKGRLIKIPLDYELMYEAVKKIFLLFEDGDMWQVPGICISKIQPSRDSYDESDSEYKWIYLNDLLEEDMNSNNSLTIENFYSKFEKAFTYSSEDLKGIGKSLRNDYWFIEMFLYSFRPKVLEALLKEKITPPCLNSNLIKTSWELEVEKMKSYKGSPQYQEMKRQNPDLFKESALNESEFFGDDEFIPSEAIIPEGFLSLGDDIKNLKFALNHPKISFRSFFNDLDFLIDGIWVEDTLYAPAFDETLFCKMVRDEARRLLALENQKRTEEINKASQRGMNIGAVIGLAATFAGWINEADTSNSAMTTMMLSNTIGRSESLRAQNEIQITGDIDFDDPYLIFKNDPGSYISISESCKTTSIKRRICLRKKFLEDGKIYFDLLPMILFGNLLATPAQVIKFENEYFLRPISAGFSENFNSNLTYNPIKIRRSYSYNPGMEISKVAKVLTTKIIGETVEKTPTINHAWFSDDESLNHFYFDYSTDGSVF